MLQNNTLWTCFRGLRSRMPFPGYQIFTKKSGKFPIPSIQEHPLPGPDLVLAFRTGIPDWLFPGFFQVSKHSGIPERFANEKYKI